jgi:NADH-quinone oxidoreductase subunit H
VIKTVLEFVESYPLLAAAIKILVVFAVLSGIVAYLVLVERKVLAFMQARLGPNRVGPWGLFQPVADGLKLLLKEDIVPAGADKFVFLIAPVISVVAAFTVFAVIPYGPSSPLIITDLNVGLLFIVAVSSLGIYGIILGGWASNSHYPLLGSLRSAAQLVSYEIPAGMALVGVLLLSNSLSLVEIVKSQEASGFWNVVLQPVGFLIFLIAAVAETNRNPFDLPEAESELTAGFHTEYSGFRFALYFMAEYTNMVLVSALAVLLFWGGWLRPLASVKVTWAGLLPSLFSGILRPFSSVEVLDIFPPVSLVVMAGVVIYFALRNPVPTEKYFLLAVAIGALVLSGIVVIPPVLAVVQPIFWFTAKIFALLYAFIWYRATFPRYRYDQLMNVGWHWLIPLALANLIMTAIVVWWAGPDPNHFTFFFAMLVANIAVAIGVGVLVSARSGAAAEGATSKQ